MHAHPAHNTTSTHDETEEVIKRLSRHSRVESHEEDTQEEAENSAADTKTTASSKTLPPSEEPTQAPFPEFIPPKAANAPIFVSLNIPSDFVPTVNQDAGILTPSLKIPDNGDAFLDEQNLQEKAKELVRFVNKASEEYKFDRKEVVWIGHSNGANMISSILLFYPTVIQKAVLLRPNAIVTPKPLPVFADVFILLSAGRQDETVPLEDTERLIRIFQQCGAVVELFQHDVGHELNETDMVAVQKWILRQN